jgi:hypothetical protein
LVTSIISSDTPSEHGRKECVFLRIATHFNVYLSAQLQHLEDDHDPSNPIFTDPNAKGAATTCGWVRSMSLSTSSKLACPAGTIHTKSTPSNLGSEQEMYMLVNKLGLRHESSMRELRARRVEISCSRKTHVAVRLSSTVARSTRLRECSLGAKDVQTVLH